MSIFLPDPPAKRQRLLEATVSHPSSLTISVHVGGSEIFNIHKSVLHSSPFFQHAIDSDSPRCVYLPNGQPSAFKVYVQWLYTRDIRPNSTDGCICTILVLAYVLGEMLMDNDFQATVMNKLVQASSQNPGGIFSIEEMNILYNGTTETSPVRKLVVDRFMNGGSRNQRMVMDVVDQLHPDLMRDINVALEKGM